MLGTTLEPSLGNRGQPFVAVPTENWVLSLAILTGAKGKQHDLASRFISASPLLPTYCGALKRTSDTVPLWSRPCQAMTRLSAETYALALATITSGSAA